MYAVVNMSSRALRKLHGGDGDILEQMGEEENEPLPVPVKPKKKKNKAPTINPFDLVRVNTEQNISLGNPVMCQFLILSCHRFQCLCVF